MSQTAGIIVGFVVLFLAFFGVTWVFTALYFRIAKERVSEKKDLEISIWLTLISFVSLIFSLAVLSDFGLLVYVFLSFLIMLIPMLLVLKRRWNLQIADALILAFSLSFVLNPYWLNLMGLI